MIIDVKATKAKGDERLPSLAFTEEKPSRGPLVLSLLLTGLALYLKSVFPGWGQEANHSRPESEPEEPKSAPKLVLISNENLLDPTVDSQPVGGRPDTSAGGFVGSGGQPAYLQPPASFMGIASPEADLLEISVPEVALPKPSIPPSGRRSANDNGPSRSFGGGESGNTAEDTEHPVDPTSYDGERFDLGGDQGLGDGDHIDTDDHIDLDNYIDPDNDDDEDDDSGGDLHPGDGDHVDPYDDIDPDDYIDPDDVDDEDDDNDGTGNRAPRVAGPVYLHDVFGCLAAVIGLSELLGNASDPDGDALSIANLTVSSGTLTQTAEGWTFSGGMLGPVTLTYEITDGALSITQHAYFSVLKSPPIVGTPGSDVLVGTECVDDIGGGDGDDNIDGRGGHDTIESGTGNDQIVAGDGDDLVRGGDGNDVVLGGLGTDWISGGKGDDRLFGGDGDDSIFGDDGDDLLNGEDGDDLLFGGAGDDLALGGAGRDVMDGGDGDDTLSGGSGDDALFGAAGSDLLEGGDGNDLLSGQEGEDQVLAEAGDDIIVGDADGADDSYDGGSGTDTLDYSAAQLAIDVDLAEGTAVGAEIGADAVTNIEVVLTGQGNDTITGSNGSEWFGAGGGDDLIAGGGGCDAVDAGEGDDTVVGALDAVRDDYEGGEGSDTLDYSATMSGVLIDLNEQTATGIEIGTDTIGGFETIIGGAGDDHFVITQAPVSLRGGEGSDLFEFEAVTGANAGVQVVHDILDFMVGDRIKISKYEIFREVMDSLEDRFEDIYGNEVAKDDLPIRIRHEQTDNIRQTLIDVDFDQDQTYEMTINISGDHVLMVVDNA